MQTTKQTKLQMILIILLLILIGANLRTALTAVPPILNQISDTFHLPAWFLGSLTTIPLLCFAIISPFVNRLVHRFGMMPVITAALIGLGIGSFVRIYSFPALLIGTLLAGSSIAILNVLSPAVVGKYFPSKIGVMTSVYTLSMTVFSALAAGLSSPISGVLGWQSTLQWLAVFSVITLAVMLFNQSVQKKPSANTIQHSGATRQTKPVWKQPLAWALTVFMGLQSLLFYTILTWVPSIFVSHGMSQNTASLLLGLLQLSSLPMAYLIPNLAGRREKQAPLMLMIFLLFFFGLGGLMIETPSMVIAVISCILLGFATNAAFSMSMILFSLKTRDPYETSAVSGMAQSIGYLAASVGPIMAGFLHSQFNSWTIALVCLIVIVVIMTGAGLMIDRQQHVFN
ncbi:CynX/NimT family MFS transporter [Lentilactobacillus parabuchneri]|uniref:CynX/NimT family MFS transporter n=1 Tax=Lentilactobacillus parabuchneri TaxID=152331 RepID=UPI002307047F|nr:MFS transporter [Lentilactobacillus parabuchneri]MDB1104099.1 MFS transporter [Lentilactobacillus parabuchneri]